MVGHPNIFKPLLYAKPNNDIFVIRIATKKLRAF